MKMKLRRRKSKFEIAQKRLAALLDLETHSDGDGFGYGAIKLICKKHKITSQALYRYRLKVIGIEKPYWLWALFPNWARKGGRVIEIPEALWDIFISAVEGPGEFTAVKSYAMVKQIASARGLSIPSYRTFMRRKVSG